MNNLLVPPKLYGFNNPVAIPANAEVLDVPTAGITDSPTSLPKGLLPDGGYKTTPLRGIYLNAPYSRDGGVAVRACTLLVKADCITIVDPSGLGLTGTLSICKSAEQFTSASQSQSSRSPTPTLNFGSRGPFC